MKKKVISFICTTPNGKSFATSLYKENWNLFHPIEHLLHFKSKNISLLDNAFNLKLKCLEYPYIGTPYKTVSEKIKLVNEKFNSNRLNKINNNISPTFFENIMSLIFEK